MKFKKKNRFRKKNTKIISILWGGAQKTKKLESTELTY